MKVGASGCSPLHLGEVALDRARTSLIIKLSAALVFAGIGHWFVAFQRDLYPLDGVVFYAASAFCFFWALRSTEGKARDAALMWRETLQRIVAELRRWAMLISAFRLGSQLLFGLIRLRVLSPCPAEPVAF